MDGGWCVVGVWCVCVDGRLWMVDGVWWVCGVSVWMVGCGWCVMLMVGFGWCVVSDGVVVVGGSGGGGLHVWEMCSGWRMVQGGWCVGGGVWWCMTLCGGQWVGGCMGCG